MLENNIVSKVVMASFPWETSFFFFFVYIFLYQERERPVYFHWNYNLDIRNTLRFYSSNSILTKFKKEEITYNVNPYIKLSQVVSS